MFQLFYCQVSVTLSVSGALSYNGIPQMHQFSCFNHTIDRNNVIVLIVKYALNRKLKFQFQFDFNEFYYMVSEVPRI